MKTIVTVIVCLLSIFSLTQFAYSNETTPANRGGIPFADSVPFLGIEEASRELKQAVCAVQLADEKTKDGKNTWLALGTGFLVEGETRDVLVVTCKHVVLQAQQAMNKPLYIGLNTDKGYHRFQCVVAYIDPSLDIAVLVPQNDPTEEYKLLESLRWFDKSVFDDSMISIL